MHNSDYYREQAAKYRQLAEATSDAAAKQELLELAAACEEVRYGGAEPKRLFPCFSVMIESIMYMGVGFLFAALIGVALVPLVYGRAVRLTVRRIEATLPQSMNGILADKDLLRAEFAMAIRRLEIMIEKLRSRNASQLVEIGKKSDSINRLKLELNTLRVAAAKVVVAYSSRGPIQTPVRQSVPGNTRRRDGDVIGPLSTFPRKRSSDRRSTVSEPSRWAG